jgi:hypothetical protein
MRAIAIFNYTLIFARGKSMEGVLKINNDFFKNMPSSIFWKKFDEILKFAKFKSD